MRLAIICAITLLVGCLNINPEGHTTHYTTDIDYRSWQHDAVVEIDNIDTISPRTLSIFVRYQPQMPLEPIPLRVTTISPKNEIYVDRITLAPTPTEQRQWRGVQQINSATWREEVVWSEEGCYKIYISPQHPISGIDAVGVVVSKQP